MVGGAGISADTTEVRISKKEVPEERWSICRPREGEARKPIVGCSGSKGRHQPKRVDDHGKGVSSIGNGNAPLS